MPQRFGQATDYSQNFAYLADQNQVKMEQAAERIDRDREDELAARDAEMFTRYQEGKVSGQEILGYIQRRVRETGYDKAQQRKWRATLVEYQNAVADETASAAYEATGDLNAFISHWKGRLGGTKTGTPERTQIQTVLTQLREQRDSKALKNGADRIMREIMRGTKSTKDLIDYYREALQSGSLSDEMRSQVKDTIAQLNQKHRGEQYQVADLKIDEQLAIGNITPQEAAKQKDASAQKWGLNTSDPVAYQHLQGEIRVLNATPDPKEVAAAEAALLSGDMSAPEFARKMDQWADQIAPFDQAAAWELRGDATKIRDAYQEAQRLPGGDVIGNREPGQGRAAQTVNKFLGDRLKHIPQMDGSRYSSLNCTMAAGAMMGHTMGTSGLTGADLRADSGDTSGGTTLVQAKYALEQNGVTGLRYKSNYGYDKFKINIKQGATAMLSGYLGNVSASEFNNGGNATWNHTVYVAKYDPKKGYLVLDSAKSKDKGTWISEATIRKFAWTGTGYGSYSRNGSVMFSPKGTLKTRWNKGKTYDPRKSAAYSDRVSASRAQREQTKRGSAYGGYVEIDEGIAFISVDTPANNPAAEQYVGQFAAGINAADISAAVVNTDAKYNTPEHKARLANAGIEYGDAGLDTRDEVVDEVMRRTETTASLAGWIQGYAEAYDGSEGAIRVANGSEVRWMTREEVSELERQLVISLDGLALLNTALGNSEGAQFARDTISQTIAVSQMVTATDMQWEMNQMYSNIGKKLADAEGIEGTRGALEEALAEVTAFTEGWAEDEQKRSDVEETTQQDVDVNELGDLPGVIPVGERDLPGSATQNDTILGGLPDALAAFSEILQDPEADTDSVNMQFIALAEQFNWELPPNWPDRMGADDASVSGPGAEWANIVDNVNTIRDIDNGLGEMVKVDVGQIYVPYIPSGGQTTAGDRDEGVGFTTTGEMAQGQELPEGVEGTEGVAYGTGAEPMLNLDYLREQGYEIPPEFTVTTDGLPKAFVMVDGEAQAISVLPTQQKYSDVSMLRIADLERLKAFFSGRGLTLPKDLKEGEMLSADQLASFPPAVVAQLVQGGENAAVSMEPFLVWTMQLDGQNAPWFMDPDTQMWHYNGLPHVGNGGQAMPGATSKEGLRYVGAKYEGGRAVPDSEGWATDSEATSGVPTPMSDAVDAQTANVLQQSGEGNADSGWRRDPTSSDIVQATPDDIMDTYINITSAAEATESAITKARELARATWDTVKEAGQPSDERVGALSGIDVESAMGGISGSGVWDLPAMMAQVGVTDSSTTSAPGYDAPQQDKLFDYDFGALMDTVQGKARAANIPKVEWKPAGEGLIKSELGYKKVEQGGYDWEGPSEYTPPTPENTVSSRASGTIEKR